METLPVLPRKLGSLPSRASWARLGVSGGWIRGGWYYIEYEIGWYIMEYVEYRINRYLLDDMIIIIIDILDDILYGIKILSREIVGSCTTQTSNSRRTQGPWTLLSWEDPPTPIMHYNAARKKCSIIFSGKCNLQNTFGCALVKVT